MVGVGEGQPIWQTKPRPAERNCKPLFSLDFAGPPWHIVLASLWLLPKYSNGGANQNTRVQISFGQYGDLYPLKSRRMQGILRLSSGLLGKCDLL